MRNLVYAIIVVFVLVSCDQNRVYEEYRTIDSAGWNKDSIAQFNVGISDTNASHNVYIDIRNKGNYPNSNIWLFLEIQEPGGTILTDTVEYVLAEKSGKWRGNGIGDLFDNQFIYRQNVRFERSGEYQFRVRQGMRAETLKGIHDVGLRIEEQNE